METLAQDIRYALRTLRKSPGFALVAILTLALGIGASTAIFSVIENILMEPFPYPDAQRYMSVLIHDTESGEQDGRADYNGAEFLDYVDQNHVFDRVIGNSTLDVLYRGGEGTLRFNGNLISSGTFEFLGMPALYGRVAQPADYEPGAPPVFVLRYKIWVNQFGADPNIINKTFILNDTPRTLIGIMPPRFSWGDADLWIPEKISRTAVSSYAGAFPTRYWYFLGHLRHGVSMKQAEADLTVVAKRLAARLSQRISKTLHRPHSIPHRTSCRPVSQYSLHRPRCRRFTPLDRMRKRCKSSPRQSHHARKGIRYSLRARSQPPSRD